MNRLAAQNEFNLGEENKVLVQKVAPHMGGTIQAQSVIVPPCCLLPHTRRSAGSQLAVCLHVLWDHDSKSIENQIHI